MTFEERFSWVPAAHVTIFYRSCNNATFVSITSLTAWNHIGYPFNPFWRSDNSQIVGCLYPVRPPDHQHVFSSIPQHIFCEKISRHVSYHQPRSPGFSSAKWLMLKYNFFFFILFRTSRRFFRLTVHALAPAVIVRRTHVRFVMNPDGRVRMQRKQYSRSAATVASYSNSVIYTRPP